MSRKTPFLSKHYMFGSQYVSEQTSTLVPPPRVHYEIGRARRDHTLMVQAWKFFRKSNKRGVILVLCMGIAAERLMDWSFGIGYDWVNRGRQYKDLVGKGIIGNHPILEDQAEE